MFTYVYLLCRNRNKAAALATRLLTTLPCVLVAFVLLDYFLHAFVGRPLIFTNCLRCRRWPRRWLPCRLWSRLWSRLLRWLWRWLGCWLCRWLGCWLCRWLWRWLRRWLRSWVRSWFWSWLIRRWYRSIVATYITVPEPHREAGLFAVAVFNPVRDQVALLPFV